MHLLEYERSTGERLSLRLAKWSRFGGISLRRELPSSTLKRHRVFPELGDVRLSELEALRGHLGLPVERDRSFTATKPISGYAREAHAAQRITA